MFVVIMKVNIGDVVGGCFDFEYFWDFSVCFVVGVEVEVCLIVCEGDSDLVLL